MMVISCSRVELRIGNQLLRHQAAIRTLIASCPGLSPQLTFDPNGDIAAPLIALGARPRVAILREQGVNGHVEMAAAFERAGFAAYDVHMTDIIGFSYGDVLGAGEGWAKSILFNARARDEFAAFFARGETFTLGVCNGCQMMGNLCELIPGAGHWPHFVRNRSEQFEARLVQLAIERSPSLFFRGGTRSNALRRKRWSPFALSTNGARRPSATRTMPTARRAGSRGSPLPTVDSRS